MADDGGPQDDRAAQRQVPVCDVVLAQGEARRPQGGNRARPETRRGDGLVPGEGRGIDRVPQRCRRAAVVGSSLGAQRPAAAPGRAHDDRPGRRDYTAATRVFGPGEAGEGGRAAGQRRGAQVAEVSAGFCGARRVYAANRQRERAGAVLRAQAGRERHAAGAAAGVRRGGIGAVAAADVFAGASARDPRRRAVCAAAPVALDQQETEMAKAVKMKAPARGVKVRMYRTGLGDCFLMAFPSKKAGAGGAFYMLVDCGVFKATPAEKNAPWIKTIVENIRDATGGKLDLLVITHEHWDHVSAFHSSQARAIFDKEITLGALWLAWTEDRSIKMADDLHKGLKAARLALGRALAKLNGMRRRGLRLNGDTREVIRKVLEILADPAAD